MSYGCPMNVGWIYLGRLMDVPKSKTDRPLDVHWTFVCYLGIKRFLHDAAVPFAELCDVDKESSSKMNPDENSVNMVNDMQDTVGQTPTFTQVLDNTLSPLGVFENVINIGNNKDTNVSNEKNMLTVQSSTETLNISRCKKDNKSSATEIESIHLVTSLKRTSSHTNENVKRLCIARYIGDLKREDFTSDRSFEIFSDFREEMLKHKKICKQSINRLKKKSLMYKICTITLKRMVSFLMKLLML